MSLGQVSRHLCQFSTLVTHQKSSKVFPFGEPCGPCQ